MDRDSWQIMIDLETMGTSCIAGIMSIGAVKFKLTGEIETLCHIGVDLQSCMNANMEIDASTLMWWLGQSKENQDRVLALKKLPLKTALQMLFDSFHGMNKYTTCIWSHGSVFDIVIVENACKLAGISIWWKYSNIRDTRTLFDFHEYKYITKGGHDALEDAVSQAEAVIAACN
jgi:DNA polymerase III epsilon subunit-like protein